MQQGHNMLGEEKGYGEEIQGNAPDCRGQGKFQDLCGGSRFWLGRGIWVFFYCCF